MSRVPPPKSNTRHNYLLLFALSKPNAIAAAVGSLIIPLHTRPANEQAYLVAYFYESLKQAGTVTTALMTFALNYVCAISFNFLRTSPDTYSGQSCFYQLFTVATILGLQSSASTTVKGQRRMSSATSLSLNRLPISRFAPQRVFLGSATAQLTAALPTIQDSSFLNLMTDGVKHEFDSGSC